jgi:hypothetical protein
VILKPRKNELKSHLRVKYEISFCKVTHANISSTRQTLCLSIEGKTSASLFLFAHSGVGNQTFANVYFRLSAFAVFRLIYCCKICSRTCSHPNQTPRACAAFILRRLRSIRSHLHNARRRANSSAKTIHPEFEAVEVSLEICSCSRRGRKTRPSFRKTAPTLCPAVLRCGRDKRVKYVKKESSLCSARGALCSLFVY